MKETRLKYYYDTIKDALMPLRHIDGSLNFSAVIDKNKLPVIIIDLEGETKNYAAAEFHEYLEGTTLNFRIHYYFKCPETDNPWEEIRSRCYYWAELIENKLESLRPVAYTDTIKNQNVQVVDIKVPDIYIIHPTKDSENGIMLIGNITTIINNL